MQRLEFSAAVRHIYIYIYVIRLQKVNNLTRKFSSHFIFPPDTTAFYWARTSSISRLYDHTLTTVGRTPFD